MRHEEIYKLVRDLKTSLYRIRAAKVSKYWASVGRDIEKAIDLTEKIDMALRESDKVKGDQHHETV